MQSTGPELARLETSTPRRAIGTATLALLAGFLLWIALSLSEAGVLSRLLLLVMSGAMLFGATRLWQLAPRGLVLDAEALRELDGTVLVRVADIETVSRGAFAFKPSNGFSLQLSQPGSLAWVPGLWWRMGRQLGVGGITAVEPAKHMAQTIAALVAARAAAQNDNTPGNGPGVLR